jgi:hypothetical protein
MWKSPLHKNRYSDDYDHYTKALQSAIDNAVEVSNPDDVLDVAFASDNLLQNDEYGRKEWKFNSVYPLTCRVEKRTEFYCTEEKCTIPNRCYQQGKPTICGQESKTVALVTFPEDKPEPEAAGQEQDEMVPLNFVRSITGWAKDDLQRKYNKWKETRKHPKP